MLQKSLYYGIVFDGDVHCTFRLGYSNLQNKKLCCDFFLLICQIEVVRSFSSDPNLIALVELFGDKDPSNERVSEVLCSFNRTINNATF